MYKIVHDQHILLSKIDEIFSIAKIYNDEIGFWPKNAIRDAIMRNRVIAATLNDSNRSTVIGFLIYGGVFPEGKIQAIAVQENYKRKGIAQRLLDAAVEFLENENFIFVRAKPAEDLIAAQKFYGKNSFNLIRIKPGGKARNRQIVVREKTLKVPNLLDKVATGWEEKKFISTENVSNRFWVIDINVLLDVVKENRGRHKKALDIVGAALAGKINLAVTSEFEKELLRNSKNENDDQLLKLARALEAIVVDDIDKIPETRAKVHELIFDTKFSKQANTDQAISDCNHIAECSLGNVDGFITSDNLLLRCRGEIRRTFGLEVVSLDDLHEALCCNQISDTQSDIIAEEFCIKYGDNNDVFRVAEKIGILPYFENFFQSSPRAKKIIILASNSRNQPIGFLIIQEPENAGSAYKMMVIIDHQEDIAEIVVDCLMGRGLDMLTSKGPNLVELIDTPSQPLIRNVACQLGFKLLASGNNLLKLALGVPITPENISRRLGKLCVLFPSDLIEDLLPVKFEDLDEIFERNPKRFANLERSIFPGLLATNHRNFVIQPIIKKFAEDLLGTSDQMTFSEQLGGSYRTEKIYICTGKNAKRFWPNQIILFYESSKGGGLKAITAAANVSNVTSQLKSDVNEHDIRHTVLHKPDKFSSTEKVTLVRFNSLLRFPKPVPLSDLKKLGAHTNQNFISATEVSTKIGQEILNLGWNDD